MKRRDLTDELYCQNCGYLALPNLFIFNEDADNVEAMCSQCGSVNVTIAKAVNWCNICHQKPGNSGDKFTICTNCESKVIDLE